jgi:uncharacterized protein
MNVAYSALIASDLKIHEQKVAAVLNLLSNGATIPFIARYRKDITGALDEVQIQNIQEAFKFQKDIAERKAFIEKAISGQGMLTPAIQEQLNAASTLNDLEDIYLPFKPKRRTKAQVARENGLESLADRLLEQKSDFTEDDASAYLNENVPDISAALQGARDIIAERISEDTGLRAAMRQLFDEKANVITKRVPGKEKEAIKYQDYFEFAESVAKIPSHRMLAVLRGFTQGFLRLAIHPDESGALLLIEERYLIANNKASEQVQKAIKDAYRRLLQPGLESEYRMALKTKSDDEAIAVFAENLRQLLLSSPLGSKRILAADPGYRTGCKIVVLDETGNLLKTDLIFIHEKNQRLIQAEHTIRSLMNTYQIDAFAIGDGTAGRETERFIQQLKTGLPVFLVNEDGASVYSASEIAREEFPDQDITVRGAASIGRRLMDPLAELVKIDPKSIGVGQYQHDVNQVRLKEKLDQTVVSCVNAVGVNLNTAGKYLLQYVSGIGPSLAEHIVRYRLANGKFESRGSLLKVERLGAKVFEQCAGFLRIQNGIHPLDASGVHPEAYPLVAQMANDLHVDLESLIGNVSLINQIKISDYTSDAFGVHTVEDILKELKKPGLDPRSEAQAFSFAAIYSIEDVVPGMVIPGVVTNLTRFGAFVDIGVKQDGLVHVSEIANRYIGDPSEALRLNQVVKVKVLEVDIVRKRIGLSVKQAGKGDTSTQNKPTRVAGKAKAESGPNALEHALSSLKKKFG